MDIQGQVGDSLTIRARVSTVVGGLARPRPLGGATLRAAVRDGDSPDADVSADNLRVSVDNAAEGIVLVSLPKTHMLASGVYAYEVDLAMGAASNETILSGMLTILPTII